MNKTSLTIGTISLALVLGVLAVGTSAYNGNTNSQRGLSEEQRTEIEAQHEEIKEALENKDYETWSEIISKMPGRFMQRNMDEDSFNEMIERHEAMEAAFEGDDYDAWYALMTEDDHHPKVVDIITEENFAQFTEIHELMEEGNIEEAQALREELGLGKGMGRGFQNRGMGPRGGRTGRGEFRGNNGNCPM